MFAMIEKPGDDEAMPSWMDYLLTQNGAETDQEKAGLIHAQLGYYPKRSKNRLKKNRYMPYLEDFCAVEKESSIFPNLETALKKHTDLYALLPFMSDGEQARRFEYCLHGSDYNMTGNCGGGITWHYCPECVKEDFEKYGRPLIHIQHQLYSNACWKHGCRLNDNPDDCDEKPAKPAQMKKAVFMHGLYEDPLISNFDAIYALVMDECEKRETAFTDLCQQASDDGYISLQPVSFNIYKEVSGTDGFLDAWTGLVAWLYGTADEFRKHCKPSDESKLLQSYICPSCGNTFHMHPSAHAYGAPCPKCAGNMRKWEILSGYAQNMHDGTYRIFETDNRIRIFHECGKEVKSFKRNIWKRRKCKCCEMKKRMMKHVGETRINHDGRKMEIIQYHSADNVAVCFDEKVPVKTSYYKFKNGLVKTPGKTDDRLIDRTGETGINTAGQKMEIIKYRSAKDIDVKVGNKIAEHKTYMHFKRGEISASGHLKDWAVGKTNKNKQGLTMEIIAYRGAKDIDVKFDSGEIVKGKRYEAFKNGKIRCPGIGSQKA